MSKDWKYLPGNELIQISDQGDVKTWETRNKRWSPEFKPNANKQGYVYFVHQAKRYPVHQLVALTFIGPPPSSTHTVDHIDQNRSNNAVTNLRYATREEQQRNQRKQRARVDARPILVWKINCDPSTATKFESVADASNELGLDHGNLYTVASGKRRSIKGYNVKFCELEEEIIPNEEFRLVDGFHVSQFGRYKKLNSIRILKPIPGAGAVYCTVGTNVSFHHLVAKAFPEIVGIKPSENHNLDHIDRNPLNNNASNLRWLTQSDQLRNQTRVKPSELASVRKIAVEISAPGSQWIKFSSIHDAARYVTAKVGDRVKDSTISRVVNERPSGYIFKRRKIRGWRVRLLQKRNEDKLVDMHIDSE